MDVTACSTRGGVLVDHWPAPFQAPEVRMSCRGSLLRGSSLGAESGVYRYQRGIRHAITLWSD